MKGRAAAALAVGAVALSALATTAAWASTTPRERPKRVTVRVGDFFFGPRSVAIAPGDSIRWSWAAANTARHDVHLNSAPTGLPRRASYSTGPAGPGASFRKAFPRAGTYRYVCTLHPSLMRMTVEVGRR